MAGFDPSLDKTLFEEEVDFERTKIIVSVKAYNEGTPKLQLIRENKKADGSTSFAKLGRLTKEEIQAILPVIQKAIEQL
ncbi:hypothetical protein KY330_05055 [Candidatus Woesearchaeota archaeon]|nr:hypothetical protein [Candidatus Woesearchaeota archaeon]